MNKSNGSGIYREACELFHEYAKGVGYAEGGIMEVPDLKPKRELFVATLLDDKSLADSCKDDPVVYYYNVLRYCVTAGIEYGAQWQLKPDGFDEENYDQILYRNNVGRKSSDITTDIAPNPKVWREFLIGLHRVWSSFMEPYLKLDDPSEHIMQSCFAVFQLGVSIALDKFDEPDDEPGDNGASEGGE